MTDNRVDERQFTEIQRDFLDPSEFYDALITRKLSFFTGVPDSLLKDFCAYVTEHTPTHRHIITANEGNAVAVAAGMYFLHRLITTDSIYLSTNIYFRK